MVMYYVYVLKSRKDGKRYTGMTINLYKRLKEHNIGKDSTFSTKYRGPFEMMYYEIVSDRKEARKREKYLKSGAGREFLESKLNNKPT